MAPASTAAAALYIPAPAPTRLQNALIALCSVPPLNRGMLRYRLAQAIVGLSDSPIDVPFRGGTIRVALTGHPTEYSILLNRTYNAPEIDFLLDGLPAGGVALDLGANVGLFSIAMAAKAGPGGRVIAIDAARRFLERLSVNVAASGLSNVTVVHAAVGDRDAMVSLVPVANNPGTATVNAAETGDVRMRPLLAILADNGVTRIDAMKVDIDGGEDAALVPFFATAPDALLPRRLVMEHALFDGGTKSIGAAEARNYRLLGKTRSNSLYERAG